MSHLDEGQQLKKDDEQSGSMHVHSDIIFYLNMLLPNSNEFFGRVRERVTLISRTRHGASTSIVGPHKIGTTWLLYYLKLVAPTELGSQYRIAYLDASLPDCKSVTKFTATVLQKLDIPTTDTNQGLARLENVVRDLRVMNQTAVICIDNFEDLASREAFDMNFFTELRAITQIGLCLVVASKRPLINIVNSRVRTSPFFNIFEQLTLKPFSTSEAVAFVNAKGKQAEFTNKERTYLLEYLEAGQGEWPPLRLQLVGKMLLEDKIAAKMKAESFLPETGQYWQNFQKRIDLTYQAVMRQ